jgi:hypothetical protein
VVALSGDLVPVQSLAAIRQATVSARHAAAASRHQPNRSDSDVSPVSVGLVERKQYTGTRCARGHDEYVVLDFLKTGGVEQFVTQHGPGCWTAGCLDNEAATAEEQPWRGSNRRGNG